MHLDHVAAISAAGGGNVARRFATTRVGPDGRNSIARLAAGAGIAAVDAVLAGTVDNAYCLHRPPGHHAEPDEAIGFCIYSNAAVAGLYALDAAGCSGASPSSIGTPITATAPRRQPGPSGTGDPARVLTALSLHQDGAFPPGSGITDPGGRAEIGRLRRGGEVGTTPSTSPLPPGSGEGAYLAAFERIVLPALRAFRPDMIFVPSGFDAGGHDPLARMMPVTSESFRRMTLALMAAAEELCGGTHRSCCTKAATRPHIVPFMAPRRCSRHRLVGRNDRR